MEKHLPILYCCKSYQTTKGYDRCHFSKSMNCSDYQSYNFIESSLWILRKSF